MDPLTVENTASILVNHVIKILSDPKSTANELNEALKPFAVIQWTKKVIDHITVAKINRLLGRLKRSCIPKETLRLVIEHFHRAQRQEEPVIPLRFTAWREVVSRTSLTTLTDPDTWVEVWNELELHRIPDPTLLTQISLAEINSIAQSSPFGELILPLWQAVRIENAQNIEHSMPKITFRNDPVSLPEALRAPSVDASVVGTEYKDSKEALGLPMDFDQLGPIARISALQAATPDSQHLLRFLSAGAQSNILEQVKHTLPSVASGVACYFAFCSLLSIAPFPPTNTIVRHWSAMFSAGKTFALYVNHLTKACQLLHIDTSWKDDGIRAICKGLANKTITKQRFSNSITPQILDSLIRAESWESPFARLCYISFLFMLRVPSEALPLIRAPVDELLLSDSSPSSQAVIGLREFQGHTRLVLRLARRKNAPRGFTAMRPCFCGANALLPKHNCPIHVFWAEVLRNTAPGQPLFPTLVNKNINRVLRASLGRIAVPDSERYSSHGFRRGAATAILDSGSSLAEIMRTAGWSSSSFRIYLNLQKAEESSMRKVLAGGESPSSDCVSSETSSATKTPPLKSRKMLTLPLSLHWDLLYRKLSKKTRKRWEFP